MHVVKSNPLDEVQSPAPRTWQLLGSFRHQHAHDLPPLCKKQQLFIRSCCLDAYITPTSNLTLDNKIPCYSQQPFKIWKQILLSNSQFSGPVRILDSQIVALAYQYTTIFDQYHNNKQSHQEQAQTETSPDSFTNTPVAFLTQNSAI